MVIIQAKLKGVTETVHGYRLVFAAAKDTLTADNILSIFQANASFGFLTFTPDKLKAEVEQVMKDRTIGASEKGRSQSEIMRGALYDYWKNLDIPNKTFEEFYNEKMNAYVTRIKQISGQLEADKIDEYYTPKSETK